MIQRFSITRLLLFIAAVGVGCFALQQAIGGANWAQAIMLVVFAAVLWVAIHMLISLMGFAMMKLVQAGTWEKPQSPFATDTPAPQIIPPNQAEKD